MTRENLIHLLKLTSQIRSLLEDEVKVMSLKDQVECYCLSESKVHLIHLYHTYKKSGSLMASKEAIDAIWVQTNRLELLQKLFDFN